MRLGKLGWNLGVGKCNFVGKCIRMSKVQDHSRLRTTPHSPA